MKKIIFVCHGNICRSPMAEWIFKHIAEENGRGSDFKISSAAVSYEEIGNDIYPPAKKILTENGIPFKKHRAHRITLDEILDSDYVVVMDSSNRYLISNLITKEASDPKQIAQAEAKVHMLLSRDVADPWYTDNFQKAYDDIYEGCSALLKKL